MERKEYIEFLEKNDIDYYIDNDIITLRIDDVNDISKKFDELQNQAIKILIKNDFGDIVWYSEDE